MSLSKDFLAIKLQFLLVDIIQSLTLSLRCKNEKKTLTKEKEIKLKAFHSDYISCDATGDGRLA